MATSFILRAVTQNSKVIFGVLRNDCQRKCLPCFASQSVMIIARTTASFGGKVTADELWQGVTSVSNPGRKRGRGRSVKRRTNLYKGQKIGVGKAGMVFPGLTGPALVGKKRVDIHQVKQEKEEEGAAAVARPELKRRFPKIPALQRGFSGRSFPGTSIGPPEPINDYVFEGFDSKVLEYKMVAHMTGNLGRKMRVSALVITGNGNGLGGYAVAKAPMGKAAMKRAKNMAAQRLQYFERYDNHTVFHDYAVTEGKTTIFVRKMPKGYGLRCHRVLKTICETVGIKDLYCKVEGQTGNIQNLTKAFFAGLMNQETHQQLADRMQLNVVEYRDELENIPIPVANPSQGFSRKDPITEEAFDFNNMYYKDGRIPLKKIVDPLARFRDLPSFQKYLGRVHRDRNQVHARNLRIVHGLEPSPEEIELRKRPLK